MKVLYKWENCNRFYPETDAFYVEVQKNEITNELLALVSKEKDDLILNEEYFDKVNRFSKGKTTHGLARKNCAYFLVDKDVSKIILCSVVYPYSGMWGAYCPFNYLYYSNLEVDEYLKNTVEIDNLEDIKYIYEIINGNSTHLLRDYISRCNIHNLKMVKKNIPILYGMPVSPPVGYFENKEIFFPNCDDVILGGCEIEEDSPKYRKKYYCKQCNENREKWKIFLESFNDIKTPTSLNKR